MIIVDVKGKNGLNNALKEYKNKVKNTKLIERVRSRKEYIKPSQKRRNVITKAIYIKNKEQNG